MTDPLDTSTPSRDDLSLEYQLAHGIRALMQHEMTVKRCIVVQYPSGEKEKLGDLLCRVGVALNEAASKPQGIVADILGKLAAEGGGGEEAS